MQNTQLHLLGSQFFFFFSVKNDIIIAAEGSVQTKAEEAKYRTHKREVVMFGSQIHSVHLIYGSMESIEVAVHVHCANRFIRLLVLSEINDHTNQA